jgi:hypothetical protein
VLEPIIYCLFQDIEPCELTYGWPTFDKGPQPKAISRISDDYDQYVGPLVSEGLIKPLLCAIHVRYDAALGVFDPRRP